MAHADRGSRRFHLSRPRLSGCVAIVAAVALSAWLVASDKGGTAIKTVTIGRSAGTTSGSSTTTTAPNSVTAAQLTARAGALGKPVYWAGAEPGARYALVNGSSDATTVRYVGASGEELLRVSTIPFANAYAATVKLASAPGAFSKRLSNGSLVYDRPGHPSTYVVFPGVDDVIEVDAPTPEEARQIAVSGRIGAIS